MHPYQQAVLADSPVAYWPLDELDGVVAHDISGNEHHGSYLGDRVGVVGPLGESAYAKEGAYDTSSYISATSPALDVAVGPFSYELWVWQHEDIAGTPGYVMIGWAGPTGSTGVAMALQAPKDFQGIIIESGGVVVVTSPDTDISKWTHLVMTWESNTLRLYVDGDEVISDAVAPPLVGGFTEIAIGRATLHVACSNAAVYDYALTPQQIADHYRAALPAYPDNIPDFTGQIGHQADPLATPDHVVHHHHIAGELVAVARELGTNPATGNGYADVAEFIAEIKSMVMDDLLPIGSIIAHTGMVHSDNWMLADGRELLIDDYPELYSVVQGLYGPAEPGYFVIPDATRRVIFGADVFPPYDVVGLTGGSETHLHSHNGSTGHARITGAAANPVIRMQRMTGLNQYETNFGFTSGLPAGQPLTDVTSGAGVALGGSTNPASSMPPYITFYHLIRYR